MSRYDQITFDSVALSLLRDLEKAGYKAYVVGGAVRDAILKRPVHDVDIATSATPAQIEAVFSEEKTLDVGRRFGTIRVLRAGAFYEITTFRADGRYEDGRHPTEVFYSTSLHEDLQRRDFTFNAMAWSPKEGLIDPFHGIQALQDGVVCAVGRASDRLREDALRILRAIRFAARFDYALEEDLFKAIVSLVPSIERISIERVQNELEEMFCAPSIAKSIDLMKCTGVWALLFRGLELCEEQRRKLNVLPADFPLRMVGVLAQEPDYRQRIHAFRFSKEQERCMLAGCRVFHEPLPRTKADLAAFLASVGIYQGQVIDVLRWAASWHPKSESMKCCLQMARELEERQIPLSRDALPINGADLKKMGVPVGPQIGVMMDDILQAIWSEELEKSRTAVEAWVRNKVEVDYEG